MTRSPLAPLLGLTLLLPGCGEPVDPGLIVASGNVEATEVRVSSKVSGTLQAILFKEGDSCAAGQPLARIDPTDTRLLLQAAGADLRLAQAELDLRLAGARPEELAEARAQVARARAELSAASSDAERVRQLLVRKAATPKSRDDSRAMRDAAAAGLDAARERLHKLESGSRAEELEAARARVAGAQARIAQLDQQLADCVLRAPLAGTLTSKLAEQGELAQRGTSVAVITDLRHPWLTVYIPGPDLPRVRLGQPAEVLTDDGQRRQGRLEFVSSTAAFTPKNAQTRDERAKLVYKLKVALDNEDGLFKPGMPAEARLRAVEPGR